MSFEAVLWATNDAPIRDVNEFAVMVMLAERADPDGCNAFPSRPTMAERTHIDPKTVLRTLQRLEARRLICKGDQAAASYIRADRRPVVYDVLIPYSWFPNVERINKERRERGRPPLTPADRPDIAAAPAKVRRSDLGKKRASVGVRKRGDFESPRPADLEDGHGVTVSPARGDSESGTGGLRDTQTSPSTQSSEPARVAPSARSAPDGRRPSTGSRAAGGGFAASGNSQRLTPQEGKQVAAFIRALPEYMAKHVPAKRPPVLSRAVLEALAVGAPHERTPEQLAEFRVLVRWDKHWGSLFGRGEVKSAVGALVAMVERKAECGSPRCDERTDVDTGQPCTTCAVRVEDRRQQRRPANASSQPGQPPADDGAPEHEPQVPGQRTDTLPMHDCLKCEHPYRTATPGICGPCREKALEPAQR